jgi:sugar phosphate isomerase/epimerase
MTAQMKIGIFTALFGDKTRAQTLDIVKAEGIEAVEFGGGAYPGSAHLDMKKLLGSKAERDKLLKEVGQRGLIISALSCHGNPIHPDKKIAKAHHQAFENCVKLASLLGIKTVNGFSGCPGDGPKAVNPNWVTCPWPDEYREVLDWQWKNAVIPYWKEQAAFLKKHKVRFAIEMHPGFVCYSNDTLLKLRNGVGKNGDAIGANFDPSHLWWQGIDPIAAVRELGREGALFHVHAKDTHRSLQLGAQRQPRHQELRRHPEPLMGLSECRVRPHVGMVEGLRLKPPHGGLRPRTLDRARGRTHVTDGGPAQSGASA